jgi:hypothetical protein
MILYYANIKGLKINVSSYCSSKSNIKSPRILCKIGPNCIHFPRLSEFKTNYYRRNNAVKSYCLIDLLVDFGVALFK